MAVSAMFGADRAAQFKSYLRQFAQTFGLTIVQPDHVPNTRRALAVSEYARDEHLLDPFRNAVMDAHWIHGQNIESDETLANLAKTVGLDSDAAVRAADDLRFLERIDAQREEAHARGVTGIPTFYFGETKVVGCRSYEELSQILKTALVVAPEA
jgi:predicted DsbA family dithiol-disulfide isomerase